MIHADQALHRLLQYQDIHTIIDIGSGEGHHSSIMIDAGKAVITNSLIPPADFVCPFEEIELNSQVDAVWMSHILEHTMNPDFFLRKVFQMLRDDGVLAVTVPPLKHSVVGGHINLFNPGVLLYRLIIAGFDCREARLGVYGYNISVLVRKKHAELPANLTMDYGDIEKLSHFFPCQVWQGFDGQLQNIRW